MTTHTLELNSLSLSIAQKTLCHKLSLKIDGNQRWGLLGKNGVGKTTLLHAIMGLTPHQGGEILVNAKELGSLSRQQLAVTMGILFQHSGSDLPATVFETVLLGRHPHVQSLLKDDPVDIEIALHAMAQLKLTELADRQITSLSGGERQRLSLAMLMAQAPQLYLLDEPSNHLDVAFQVELLTLLDNKIREQSASLLMATHDINLAARFCDNIVLLLGDGDYIAGTKDEVLNAENLSVAFDCQIRKIEENCQCFYFPA